MSGICSARVVGGTVLIPLAFMLPFHRIYLHFLPLYLQPIPIISKLPRSSARHFLHHLLHLPPVANPSTGPNTLGMVSITKTMLLAVCEHHERMVADPTVAAFLSDLKKMLN
jgi:hypothetical protein